MSKMKSKLNLLILISLVLALVTSSLNIHTDIKSVIYGLAALGLILGAYFSVKKPKESKGF